LLIEIISIIYRNKKNQVLKNFKIFEMDNFNEPFDDDPWKEDSIEKIEVEKNKLQKLIDYFFATCNLCDEMDIYEFPEGDKRMREMKIWVKDNFGRKLKK